MHWFGLLLVVASIALAWATGRHAGVHAERWRRILTPADTARRRETLREAVEADLRRRKGLPRKHPNPEEAPHIRKARIRKR